MHGNRRAGFTVLAWAHRLLRWFSVEIATLYPGAFAVVMATGIVSNAFFLESSHLESGHLESSRALSDGLFAISLLAYCVLIVFTGLRAIFFTRRLWTDLTDPRLIFSYFTIVAGTDVLASALTLRGLGSIASALWFFALVAWIGLIYFSFAVLTFYNTPRGADIIHGGWLMAIVATQSLAILATLILPELGDFARTAFVLAHMLWGVGLMLYGIFIALFSWRAFFLEVDADDLTPSLWIVMGAAAISVNAGSALVLAEGGTPLLHSMHPFVDGVTLVMWAWATWWIPLLLLFSIWKHGVCRRPLSYTPTLWSLVFPLGMYSVATLRFSLTADFPPLRTLSHVMAWIALIAWMMTTAGLAVTIRRSFRAFGEAQGLRQPAS